MLEDIGRLTTAAPEPLPPPPPAPPPPPRSASPTQARPAQAVPSDVITNSIGMRFVRVEPGSFLMGSEKGEDNERPVHPVTITKPCCVGVHPVTNDQYTRVMGLPPVPREGRNLARGCSWHEAEEFCRKLSDMEGVECRLPTEAEWEYACRAGATTEYCFGDSPSALGEYAWMAESIAFMEMNEVGQKKPNAWGLHDMHGGSWEWCLDWYGPYTADPGTDPTGPETGGERVLRGGSYLNDAGNCRSATRGQRAPQDSGLNFGFRVVRAAGPLP